MDVNYGEMLRMGGVTTPTPSVEQLAQTLESETCPIRIQVALLPYRITNDTGAPNMDSHVGHDSFNTSRTGISVLCIRGITMTP